MAGPGWKRTLCLDDRLPDVTKPPHGRPPAGRPELTLLPRIFAVLAAILLVGSVALAALLPPEMSLKEALAAWDATLPEAVQHVLAGSLGSGFWDSIVVPILLRPSWMIPVCLGLICVGGAVTATPRTPTTTRKRS